MDEQYTFWQDDDNVIMPKRAYTDIERQDSSVNVRNRMRSMWSTGEHLWDIDYNNNMTMLRWWNPLSLYRYSIPAYPWIAQLSLGNQAIVRSGGREGLVAYSSPGGIDYWVPFTGAKIWARAERLALVYGGAEWLPAFYAKRFPVEIEIALFAHRPKAGKICASYVATEKFQLRTHGTEPFDRHSRFRCNRNERWGYILKNGVEIGNAYFHRNGGYPSGRVSLLSNVTEFDVGDVLSLRAPSPLRGVTSMNLTLLGRLIP